MSALRVLASSALGGVALWLVGPYGPLLVLAGACAEVVIGIVEDIQSFHEEQRKK